MAQTAIAETKESRAYRLRWWALAAVASALLVLALNGTVLNVALPTIQSKWSATNSQLQWMVNVYMLVSGALVLTCGGLCDRLGRAKFLQAGLVVFGMATLGAVFSTNATQLIIARGFQGLGNAMVQPCILAIITNIFPKEERRKAIAIYAGLATSGLALGPIIGGAIVQNIDWKWIFWFNIPVIAAVFSLNWFLVPNSRDDRPHRLDLPGNVLFFAGAASLIYGLNNAGSHGWTDPIVLGTIIGSVLILTLFVLWERRTAEPLLNMSFFRSVGFSTSLAALAIEVAGFIGIQYLLTFYMQFVQGYTAFQTGIRYLPIAFGMIIGSIASTRLAARLGLKGVTTLGFLGGALTLVSIAFLKVSTPYLQLGVELFFLCFFMGCIGAPAVHLLMESLPKAKAGIGSAVNSVANYLIGSIGIAALGSILASIYSSHFLKAAESIQGLPAALVDKASDSVGMAVGIAHSGQLPPDLVGPLVGAARQSFMTGWQIVAIILSVLFAVGAALCLKFMPGRNVQHHAEHGRD
jgi:EmrB/QacA subfamily drug resistance transporter